MNMVKIKLPFNSNVNASPAQMYNTNESLNDSQNKDSCLTPSNDNAKLWDNDELVMKALRVYGKMPRPQVFNEISRVCKLSNLRKSRYFHEKMMKNNPFKDKIMQIINEEGEHNYPYFKIFFEEYKTKKQRLSLINNENVANVHNFKKENNNGMFNSVHKLDNSVENSVENSNDYENSCSDQIYYNNDGMNNENYDYNDDYTDNMDMNGHSNGHEEYNTDFDQTENLEYNQNQDHYEQPNEVNTLVDTNTHYLENLELKLKILNKERENMVDYFETFSTVIDNLKNDINIARADMDSHEVEENVPELHSKALHTENTEILHNELSKLTRFIEKLKNDTYKFNKSQAALREELKVTKNYAHVENTKLQDDLNACKAQLSIKDEEIMNLKKRLEDSTRQNRVSCAKHQSIQSNASMSRNKLNELKETMDRMFAQIQTLS